MITQTKLYTSIIIIVGTFFAITIFSHADYFPYDGRVYHDVKRDRIMAIAEDHYSLVYTISTANTIPTCAGTTCPDTTTGGKTSVKYCWGGEVTTKQFLEGLSLGLCAGNRDTSGGSGYGTCAVGTDCSGFVSQCWTAPRRATSSFSSSSVNINWDDLRMGDAVNKAGSHIRLFDYFTNDSYTAMIYESTGTGWRTQHRSLARDNAYQPIRYNDPGDNKVYDYPEPDITKIVRNGIERVLVRWDGQANVGFKLYISNNGSLWTLIRSTDDLTPIDRYCDVSGLLPDHTYYFKMTAQNSGGDTIDSDVVAYRMDGAEQHRVLLVDGFDRWRETASAGHTFMTLYGAALAAQGIGFDFCHNEAVVDAQIDLSNYEAVIWMLGNESTFDETFSWPEQMRLMDYLINGGRLFISGAEIGWDIDYKANDSPTYKNGHVNDKVFYNYFLRSTFVNDDAQTYHVTGSAGSIFAGLDFYFDDGTHGTYDVASPDTISPFAGSTVGMTYTGGLGGNACVYENPESYGAVVYLGFPFETVYPESARFNIMKAVLGYYDLPVEPPTIKSALQTNGTELVVKWEGCASEGFRLFQKTEGGAWVQIKNELTLGGDARSATVSGLTMGTRYSFKVQAVNSSGASSDSDVVVCTPATSGDKILVVDGYDRWNAQTGGWANHTLLENFADALSSNSSRYDSCSNESVTEGDVALSDYNIVMWMAGEESTECETFGVDEQKLIESYLKAGGKFFASGAEIGWDLVYKANSNNDYANGSSNDTPFYNNYLKAGAYTSGDDDAGTYNVTGVTGTDFAGLSFSFDDGTHGTYDVDYPDILTASGGSANALYYNSGPNIAGLTFEGTFPGGTKTGKIIFFGFPFETIYNQSNRASVMSAVLTFFEDDLSTVDSWIVH